MTARPLRWFWKWASWNLEVDGATIGHVTRRTGASWAAHRNERWLSTHPTMFGAMSALLRALGER